jgi:ABC-type transport system involved in multi-copper enzyme maturation permease subunit
VTSALGPVWALAAKDAKVARREVMSLVQGVTLPVNYLLMMMLFVLSGGGQPTAVVMQDHGSYAREFVAALESARTYKVTVESQQAADAQMQAGKLVTEITIPAGFGQAITRHQPMTVPVMFNNLNEDLFDDGTRGIRLALASFYAMVSPGQVPVTVDEHDAYPDDTGYIPFLALAVVVIAVMVAGLLQAGNATAREYEQGTIRGLLLAPVRPWQILAGRMLGAYLMSLPSLAVVLAVVVLGVGDQPARLWLALAVALLTLAVFVPAGVLLGTVTRDRQLVAIFTRGLPVPLFFLSGVFAPLSFQTAAVQDIGQLMPVHWAIILVQYAFKGFGTGTLPLPADAAILVGYLVLFTALSAAALRITRRIRTTAVRR